VRSILQGIVLAGVLFSAIEAQPAFAAVGSTPVGSWLTEDGRGVIQIYVCADGVLCGRIIGMKEPDPSDSRRDRGGAGRCGLVLLRDARETEPGVWFGKITNPEDGSVWNCTLRVDEYGQLRLRGYVLVPLLGQTQVWKPYGGSLSHDCRMS
jgi:uncharacterized protein (DUF2147 family)